MNQYCGYYSVIQYCPDRTLMEAASIGVLLFCPDLKFVGVRTTQNSRRIEKVFGKSVGSENFLQSYKDGLGDHFTKKFPNGVSFETMQGHLRSFVNDICFTDIRTTLVASPEQDLDSLFVRIFGTEQELPINEPIQYRPRRQLLQALRAKQRNILEKIAIPKTVQIPEYAHSINPTMVFLNECVNFVVPKVINEGNATKQAGFGLVVGGHLAKHKLEWGKTKMIILGSEYSTNGSVGNGFFDPYRDMLRINGVDYYNKKDDLIQHILDVARDLPENLAIYAASRQKVLFA